MALANTHRELKVYIKAFDASMNIYQCSKSFPKEEIYSLTDQIRRSSRSVSTNIAEAFRRRKYPKSFASKLNECEAEAAETQNWLDYALKCHFISAGVFKEIDNEYNSIIAMLIKMRLNADSWKID
jgi:four helix bundle protein